MTGTSDGKIYPLVLNPGALTGDNYKVTFDSLGWNLLDVTKGKTLLAHQQNQSGDNLYNSVDGVFLKVTGPPYPGMINWTIPSGTRRFSPVNGWTGIGLEGFSDASNPTAYSTDGSAGTIGMAANFAFWGSSLTTADYRNTLLKLAAVDNVALWDPKATPADANFSKAYRWMRHAPSAAADPSFAPWIINTGPGTYPYQDFNYSVPFSAWNMETTPPTRLAVGCYENNAAGSLVDGRYWPQTASGTTLGSTTREMAFIFASPYSTTPNPKYQADVYASSFDMMWILSCSRRAEGRVDSR